MTTGLPIVSGFCTHAEMAAANKHIGNSKDRRLALEDVGWAVLNSKEFLFQH